MSTVSEAQQAVQDGLDALRATPGDPRVSRALQFLVPEGFHPVVKLEEENPQAPTALSGDWNPGTASIRISFQPVAADASAPEHLPLPRYRPVPVRGEPVSFTIMREREGF